MLLRPTRRMILGASAGLTLPAGAKAQEGWRSRWPVLRFGVITTETGDALSTTYRGFDEYLARALGVRTEIFPGLQSSLALWQLNVDSELVFRGDAGDTAPSRASRRYGVEWSNHYAARRWLLIDADMAISQARYTQYDPAGASIPGSIGKVAALGVTLTDFGPWFGQFRVRYFGPRPLTEDGSQQSRSTTLANLRIGVRLMPMLRLSLDVFNLFNRQASDIDYFYTSRLPGEPLAGVDDRHFHPVESRTVRLTLSASF